MDWHNPRPMNRQHSPVHGLTGTKASMAIGILADALLQLSHASFRLVGFGGTCYVGISRSGIPKRQSGLRGMFTLLEMSGGRVLITLLYQQFVQGPWLFLPFYASLGYARDASAGRSTDCKHMAYIVHAAIMTVLQCERRMMPSASHYSS
jgi:hypothetical protein